ncbi:hypothetical protein GCM10007933_11100 [Zoogloea oryzae]|uniref:TonB-dependent receptor n=1 Tax=Zoogloea oryzae TaxID=310767 RepID=A0ABQ6F7X1_9RHOO|nr:TonB-dependent receptor [Zoogloea oryzae]GLT21658.1 hypothetical protein GCM10007933_11100 [Zoogloea oryzae]
MPPIKITHHLSAPLRTLPLLITLLPLTALANPDDISEAGHLSDLPVVLSATRLSQAPADAPGAVTVLDREMIRASGARNIYELFRLVPGFQLGMHTGNQPLVTYHGLSDEAPRRMLVQVDGRSIYSPYLISGVEWNQIGVDIDDIERIEVFRGSNSATYGSNAFLGVANIITRSPSETLGGAVRYRAGDNGINDIGARIGHQFNDVSMRLTVSRTYDHGFGNYDKGAQNINDWRYTQLATLNTEWRADSTNSVDFQTGWTDSHEGTGKADNATDPERPMRIYTGFGLLRWRHAPAPGEELTVTYYHQEENGRDNYNLDVPARVTLGGATRTIYVPVRFDYDFKATRDDLELQRITTLAPSLRAVIGAGWRTDLIAAPSRFNTNEPVRSTVTRAFGTLEWRASERWLFNVGTMIEDNSLTRVALAPRASANYHMTESQTWRLSVNRSHRNPMAFEQRSSMIFSNSAPFSIPGRTIPAGTPINQTFRPSPDLHAERITTYELGYLAELREIATTIDARLFLERARDLVEMKLEPSTVGLFSRSNTRYFTNSGEANIRGLEISATWRPSPRTWLTAHHTALRIDNPNFSATEAKTNSSGWIEYTAPKQSSTLFGAWEFLPGWQFSFAKHWIGSMSWYQDNWHKTAPYRQLDLRLARRLPASIARGEVSITARNVDGPDQTYAPDTSWWARTIFAGVNLEL